MTTATVTNRRSKSSETPQEALRRIQSMEFCGNDILVIQAFSDAGIPPEDIDPRFNVLTFRAWKGKGRRVARGAKSIPITVWIPKNGEQVEETDENGDGKKKRGGMYPKTTRLFHESQTVDAEAPKGTRPKAWQNAALVRANTYEPEEEPDTRPASDDNGRIQSTLADTHDSAEDVEPWTEETTIAQADAEMRAKLTGQPVQPYDGGGPTIGDIRPESETAGDCSCPMVGVMTNVDCPLHGGR